MDNNQPQSNDREKDKALVPEVIKVKDIINKHSGAANFFIKIGNLNVFNHEKLPGFLKAPYKKRREKHYDSKRFHLIVDIVLLFIIVAGSLLTVHLLAKKDLYISINVGRWPIVTLEKKFDISSPEIIQTLIEPQNSLINSGDDITVEIKITNLNKINIDDVEITTQLDGQELNYQLTSGQLDLSQNTLASQGTITNKIKLAEVEALGSNITITTQISFKTQNEDYSFISDPIIIKVNSNLSFTSQAKYYTADGDQLGIGPLPPKVDHITSYWLFWKLQNGANTLNNLKISGILPQGINFTGKASVTSGQGINFNPSTRTVSWEISELAATGYTQAGFEVELVPTISQVGTSPLLLTNSSATANDAYTEQEIIKNGANLSIILNDFGPNSNFTKVVQ